MISFIILNQNTYEVDFPGFYVDSNVIVYEFDILYF